MALSFGVGDYIEGGVLVAVIVLNVAIGFFQEFKAEKKMDSLRELSSPSAAVLRDGRIDVIPRYIFSCSYSISYTLNKLIVLKSFRETLSFSRLGILFLPTYECSRS